MTATRLLIVSGKGGVGKSAIAAASALAARRQGARVLAIDMANGGGLGVHLGTPELSFEAKELVDGLFALTVIRSEALVEYLRVQIGLPGVATIGPAARIFDALASAAPAVREVVTIGKVLWEVKRGAWDVVVADAPPTGQVGSYLRAARTIRELVATGRILDQVEWMEDLLADPDRTELQLVTLLEELPVLETIETLDWLGESEIVGLTTVVANRVLPDLKTAVPAGHSPVADAARLHKALRKTQVDWQERIDIDRRVPFMFDTYTPSEVARRIADTIEATK